jgi:hypothetical protein
MKKINFTRKAAALSLASFLVVANLLIALAPASAATLTNTYIRLNRMAAGQTTSFRLVFKTVGAGATSVAINFNGADGTTWTGSSGVVNTTQTVSSGSCAADTGATALPGSITAAGASSTVTISSVTALSATTTYCVDLTSATAVTNATAGEYHPTVTAGSDSTTVAVRTVSSDQITVNAVVPPTFNFVIGGCASNTDAFTANLSTGSVGTTTGCTVTVNTNAKTGWFAWAKDSSTGLNSTSASNTIAATTPGTNATLSAGTEGYVFSVTGIAQGSGAGTASATNAYGNGSGGVAGANQGSGLDSTMRLIASSTGTANSAVLTVKERAAISATTPAASDYTDTITIIGAGSF